MQKLIKRIFDILISLIVLIVFLPFLLIIFLMIKLDSNGPVIFTQERPGWNKQIFKVFKLRTMKLGSEKMVMGKEVLSDDDRVTRVGKYLRRYKVDEIPQLFNVLKGDMSLVGPRPERMDYLNHYTEEELRRFTMRPGLTGLAQVNGNIYITLEERHKYDVLYVDNYSLMLDIRIICRTILVILLGEDKFSDNQLEINI